MTFPRAYAGIGSRETPPDILETMGNIGQRMAALGWRLRSGGATGADSAYEDGCKSANGAMSIYLPWRGFNGRGNVPGYIVPERDIPDKWAQAISIAATHHRAWERLGRGPRALMARNVFQVLGDNLNDPVKVVLCWGKGSKVDADGLVVDVQGGTGLAVRLAASCDIRVVNLAVPGSLERTLEAIEKMEAARPTCGLRPA